jgi:hypothetical protein
MRVVPERYSSPNVLGLWVHSRNARVGCAWSDAVEMSAGRCVIATTVLGISKLSGWNVAPR